MKRFAAFFFALILCSLLFGMGTAETAVDFDLSAFNRGITYAQMVQVCNAPQDYAGKLFCLKGKFNYAETSEKARIIFSDNSGCCELAMQFIPGNTLVYPDDFPALYSDITLTARLVVDQTGSEQSCWFEDAALDWPKQDSAQ